MKLPKLYKLSATGKIQEWEIEVVEGMTNHFGYIVTHGQQGGKLQISAVTWSKPKNVGKANETTSEQQAISEAQSKWKKQLDKGYRADLDAAKLADAKMYLPMLAQEYSKAKNKIKFPCVVQPKLDGIRCLAYRRDGRMVLQSRKGKEFKSIPHIAAALELIITDEHTVLDGELFKKGDDFETIASAVKRDEPSDLSKTAEYHIYDMFDLRRPSMTYRERLVNVRFVHSDIVQQKNPCLRIVQSKQVNSEAEIEAIYEQHIAEGYEGSIVRNLDGPYEQNRRSPNLQKVKPMDDEEFEIIGGKEGEGAATGMCVFQCITKAGHEFDVFPKGTAERRRQYLKDLPNLIGKMLTVEFNGYTNTDEPKPRFPRGKAIRDYE